MLTKANDFNIPMMHLNAEQPIAKSTAMPIESSLTAIQETETAQNEKARLLSTELPTSRKGNNYEFTIMNDLIAKIEASIRQDTHSLNLLSKF